MVDEQNEPAGRTKRCVCCAEDWPTSYFHRNKLSADGLNNWCARCQRLAKYRRRRDAGKKLDQRVLDEITEWERGRIARKFGKQAIQQVYSWSDLPGNDATRLSHRLIQTIHDWGRRQQREYGSQIPQAEWGDLVFNVLDVVGVTWNEMMRDLIGELGADLIEEHP